jgi:hypothetical protein
MKLKEALVAWTSKWRANPLRGAHIGIAVEPFRPGRHTITKLYKSSWGACNTYVKKLTRRQRQLELMQLFNVLVLRDGLQPEEVHRELWKIDEYREAIEAAPV